MHFSSLAFAFAVTSARVVLAIPANGTCYEFNIPVSASSAGLRYTYPAFKDNYDVTDFMTNLVSRGSEDFNPMSGSISLSGNYTLGGGVCNPNNSTAGRENIMIVPTHGFGTSGFYWDPPSTLVAEQNNWADYLVNEGYSVFNFDRLGVHRSTRVDGYTVAQTSQQVAVLNSLINLLRSGQFTGSIGVPEKIVLVGHGYGSFLSNAIVAGNNFNTSLIDGLILTGFGYNMSTDLLLEAWDPKIGFTDNTNFTNFDTGYLAWNDLYSNLATFFRAPYNRTLANLTEKEKQPFAISEALTLDTLDLYSPGFTGPVQIMNGQRDLVVCDGDCTDVVEPYASKMFPNAKVVEVLEHPESGHAINWHNNATGAFEAAANFLNTYVA